MLKTTRAAEPRREGSKAQSMKKQQQGTALIRKKTPKRNSLLYSVQYSIQKSALRIILSPPPLLTEIIAIVIMVIGEHWASRRALDIEHVMGLHIIDR